MKLEVQNHQGNIRFSETPELDDLTIKAAFLCTNTRAKATKAKAPLTLETEKNKTINPDEK